MTFYRLLLLLLVTAVVGALAVYLLRGDTGYVLIQRGDIAIETTVVNAVFLLLAALALLYAVFWLLRWPMRLWQAGARRSARRRFLDGMIALVAGRPNRAGQQLLKATKLRTLKLPALIAAHAAAHARGDRAEEAADAGADLCAGATGTGLALVADGRTLVDRGVDRAQTCTRSVGVSATHSPEPATTTR